MKGQKHSEESKEKIRQALLGRKFSEETIEKFRHRTGKHLFQKGNIFGKARLGCRVTEETRQKMCESQKNRTIREKLSGLAGKPRSDETRQKISQTMLGKKQSKASIEKRIATKAKIREAKQFSTIILAAKKLSLKI